MTASPVSADEPITRFARHTSQYSAQAGRVRHTAFMPPRPSLRLSVFRTAAMDEADTWKLADEVVAPDRRIQARADLRADRVRAVGLDVEPEPTPHPAHADIVGWPEEKPEQMEIAKLLAVASTLVLRSEP